MNFYPGIVKIKNKERDWLLIKRHDAESRSGVDITKEHQTSVLTGRTLEDLSIAKVGIKKGKTFNNWFEVPVSCTGTSAASVEELTDSPSNKSYENCLLRRSVQSYVVWFGLPG
jgi:hypothetical protein